MSGHKITKQVIVTSQASINATQVSEDTAFFTAGGLPVMPGFAPVTATGAAGTAAKTTTTPEPLAGTCLAVTFTSGNTAASPTIAFNGGTARAIVLGGAASAALEITVGTGGMGFFYFDGTSLHQFGVIS
jgi:hypothetical protein